ncbi:MAG TPA: VTT domain-containing protein [Caldimonas sp.]|nr:VTT domain-containing protein [Caldimonas sp.]
MLAAFMALDGALCALCIPGAALLSLAGGALFGLATGALAASCASTLGATLAFFGARHLFRDALRRRLGPRLAALDAGILRDGAAYLFTLRLVPIVPAVVINPAMGLTAMRARTFWIVTQAGTLPATLVYANAGTELGRLTSLGDVFSPRVLASLALLAAMPWLGRLAVRRWRR